MIKRQHKMLDYDRFRTNLAKLKVKAEKTISEEKQVYKVCVTITTTKSMSCHWLTLIFRRQLESQLDIATQDYEYLNGILKEDLPRIIQLRTQLVDPMFQEFYFLQCRIYGMLLARMQEVISTNGLHFETLTMGVEEGFEARLSQFNARTELEESGLLKQGGRAWLGGMNGSMMLWLVR
jgi:amphiphysin